MRCANCQSLIGIPLLDTKETPAVLEEVYDHSHSAACCLLIRLRHRRHMSHYVNIVKEAIDCENLTVTSYIDSI